MGLGLLGQCDVSLGIVGAHVECVSIRDLASSIRRGGCIDHFHLIYVQVCDKGWISEECALVSDVNCGTMMS